MWLKAAKKKSSAHLSMWFWLGIGWTVVCVKDTTYSKLVIRPEMFVEPSSPVLEMGWSGVDQQAGVREIPDSAWSTVGEAVALTDG